MKIKCMIDIA